jgi:hypothetical protein
MSDAHSRSRAIRRLAALVVLLLIGGIVSMASVLVSVIVAFSDKPNAGANTGAMPKDELAWRHPVPTDWPPATAGYRFHHTGVDNTTLLAWKGVEARIMGEYRAGVPVECCEGVDGWKRHSE